MFTAKKSSLPLPSALVLIESWCSPPVVYKKLAGRGTIARRHPPRRARGMSLGKASRLGGGVLDCRKHVLQLLERARKLDVLRRAVRVANLPRRWSELGRGCSGRGGRSVSVVRAESPPAANMHIVADQQQRRGREDGGREGGGREGGSEGGSEGGPRGHTRARLSSHLGTTPRRPTTHSPSATRDMGCVRPSRRRERPRASHAISRWRTSTVIRWKAVVQSLSIQQSYPRGWPRRLGRAARRETTRPLDSTGGVM